MHCRMSSSIPDLYALDSSGTPPAVINKNALAITKCPGGGGKIYPSWGYWSTYDRREGRNAQIHWLVLVETNGRLALSLPTYPVTIRQ